MRRFATLAASALLFTAGSAIFAPAANAAVTPNDDRNCPPSSFCLFQFNDYMGLSVSWPGPNNHGFDCDFSAWGFNNKASSMINNTGKSITLYQYVGCNPNGGDTYVAKPHSVDTHFSNNSFDNEASGIYIP